jgi:hypothetical protein
MMYNHKHLCYPACLEYTITSISITKCHSEHRSRDAAAQLESRRAPRADLKTI